MGRRRPLLFLAIALALTAASGVVVSGCGKEGADESAIVPPGGIYRGSEPPAGIPMPQLTLRDVLSGKQVDAQDLRGKVVLITFLDTDCKDKCPLIASAIGEGLRLLSPNLRQKTSAVAISVNPLIDTRPSVRRFLRQRHADAITYLCGSVAELKPVWKKFGVVSAYETGDADAHSADVRVFDPQGIWVATQHSGVDLTPANLAHDIERAMES
jgi:cytochrome oxidase Cu insertion factor (SCO1/SenC/PrrC family)